MERGKPKTKRVKCLNLFLFKSRHFRKIRSKNQCFRIIFPWLETFSIHFLIKTVKAQNWANLHKFRISTIFWKKICVSATSILFTFAKLPPFHELYILYFWVIFRLSENNSGNADSWNYISSILGVKTTFVTSWRNFRPLYSFPI